MSLGGLVLALLTMVVFGLVTGLTRRSATVLIPAILALAFYALMRDGDLYARVRDDIQYTIYFSLIGATIVALVVAVFSRASKPRRRSDGERPRASAS